MLNLYILIGNIGSGKSTWAREKVKSTPRTIIVNRDALRTMVGGGEYIFDKEMEPFPYGIPCTWKNVSPEYIHLNFSNKNIRFCGENCMRGKINFRPYTYPIENLINDSKDFFSNHVNTNCPTPCHLYRLKD